MRTEILVIGVHQMSCSKFMRVEVLRLILFFHYVTEFSLCTGDDDRSSFGCEGLQVLQIPAVFA